DGEPRPAVADPRRDSGAKRLGSHERTTRRRSRRAQNGHTRRFSRRARGVGGRSGKNQRRGGAAAPRRGRPATTLFKASGNTGRARAKRGCLRKSQGG